MISEPRRGRETYLSRSESSRGRLRILGGLVLEACLLLCFFATLSFLLFLFLLSPRFSTIPYIFGLV